MRTLEEEGLVTKVPYRGAVVTEVGPEVIEEMASQTHIGGSAHVISEARSHPKPARKSPA